VNNGVGSPVPVQILGPNGYSNVTVGHRHLCAVYAVGSWREVNCFGNNTYGQMAIDYAYSNLPFILGSYFGYSVSRVTTQENFTCADQTSGIVQCAGLNNFGQLGNGVIGGNNYLPQNVGNGMALRGVSTGPNHACAIDPSNRAYCWGNGNRGQLGNNTWAYTPQGYIFATPQTVLGGLSFRAIAAGGQHTCAVATDNKVFCWGDNGFGQLGLFYNTGFQASPTWYAM
jgi:alpha-tubulin suppressor-like RCC1 family protein